MSISFPMDDTENQRRVWGLKVDLDKLSGSELVAGRKLENVAWQSEFMRRFEESAKISCREGHLSICLSGRGRILGQMEQFFAVMPDRARPLSMWTAERWKEIRVRVRSWPESEAQRDRRSYCCSLIASVTVHQQAELSHLSLCSLAQKILGGKQTCRPKRGKTQSSE